MPATPAAGRPAWTRTGSRRYRRVGPCRRASPGPEQVFRVRITRPVANFGVVITQRGTGSRVEPRVVSGGDEDRLTGYAALPLDQNPYVTEFGSPVPAAGALRPRSGHVLRRLRQPDASRCRDVPLSLLGRRPGTTQGDRRTADGAYGRGGQDPRAGRGLRRRRALDRGDARRPSRSGTAGRVGDQDPDHGPLRRAAQASDRARGLPGDAQQRRTSRGSCPNTRVVAAWVTVRAR